MYLFSSLYDTNMFGQISDQSLTSTAEDHQHLTWCINLNELMREMLTLVFSCSMIHNLCSVLISSTFDSLIKGVLKGGGAASTARHVVKNGLKGVPYV